MKGIYMLLLAGMAWGTPTANAADPGYGRWVPIKHWQRCERMLKKGSVFEIQNAEGVSMQAACTAELPARPSDWQSDPVRFRVIRERKIERSPEMAARPAN